MKNFILVPPGTVCQVELPNGETFELRAHATHDVYQKMHAIFCPLNMWVTFPVDSEAGPAGTRVKKIRHGDGRQLPKYQIREVPA